MSSAYEHRPWSTFGDADKIAPYNPLRRVPTLVLDDGEVLIESAAILDYLDELVGPERAMIAASGPARRRRLKICALGSGLGRQGGQPDLRAGAAQGAVENLGRALRGPDRRRARRCWKRSAPRSRRRSGSGAHRPCRHHGGLRAALYRRGASRAASAARYPALTAHAARCEALPAFRRSCRSWIRRRGLRGHRGCTSEADAKRGRFNSASCATSDAEARPPRCLRRVEPVAPRR